jgi:cell division septum initiation protein DivIVA
MIRVSNVRDDGYEQDEPFTVVLFGYDKDQVDRQVDELSARVVMAEVRSKRLLAAEAELLEAQTEIEALRRELTKARPGAIAGANVQQMLRAAEAEASVQREQAERVLKQARQEAERLLRQAREDSLLVSASLAERRERNRASAAAAMGVEQGLRREDVAVGGAGEHESRREAVGAGLSAEPAGASREGGLSREGKAANSEPRVLSREAREGKPRNQRDALAESDKLARAGLRPWEPGTEPAKTPAASTANGNGNGNGHPGEPGDQGRGGKRTRRR